MKDLKRAFGAPTPEFHERICQTLFQIKEKEDAPVRKKLTLSIALAFALCICIAAATALAGSALLTQKPDVTNQNMTHSDHSGENVPLQGTAVPIQTEVVSQPPMLSPTATPDSIPAEIPDTICAAAMVYPSLSGSHLFHSLPICGEAVVGPAVSLTDALNMGLQPCRDCLICYIGEESDFYHMSESCKRLSSPQLQLVSMAVRDGCHPCGVCVCFLDLNNAKHHRFARCAAFGDGVNAYIPCSLDFPAMFGSSPCELCVSKGSPAPRATAALMPTAEPDCAESPLRFSESGSGQTVFLWDSDAPVYHSVYNCSGCEYLHQMELSDAAASGIAPCPDCVLCEAAAFDTVIGMLPPLWSSGASEIYFYDYTVGHSGYFHKDSICDAYPMTAPIAISLETAFRFELPPCPACSNLLKLVIISKPGDKHYHVSDECEQFSAPKYLTLYEAKELELEPCRKCIPPEA